LRVLVAIRDRPVALAVITIRPVALGVIAIRPSIIDRWRRRRGYIDPRGEDTAHDCSNTGLQVHSHLTGIKGWRETGVTTIDPLIRVGERGPAEVTQPPA
jgi:hypothetical protein